MQELLTVDDKAAIADAVKRAELLTSGEIVFALTDASGHYPHATYEGALATAVVASAIYLAMPFPHYISLLLWSQLVAFASGYALFARVGGRRWFLRDAELDSRVRSSAMAEFYASGLFRTREENGVLIYLSRFEHRVVVLGDRAIHEKMGDRWDEVRDRIIQGIHAGRAREGICEAIQICGRALAQHFPRRDDDVNELANDVIDRKLK